ncbi:HlyD family efflux transporter periplasmic adaptor subunit [Oleiagrimonas sp. C23AA]|uniref:efflux RND transporter periplasmic adaptor subunit n=1 Tax=Oleiagrimonas sp. C23AA TaxID=2719047 RepID=UPI00141E80B1|nr:HlyD family efflux transporter periplasmic adaptor subunit [Oleiagrimonas sp. C23AA]NII11118.1 HlyD family efflux transporter periplasmic adaptor subunit [Oleiagrimonas sp. C23AA]
MLTPRSTVDIRYGLLALALFALAGCGNHAPPGADAGHADASDQQAATGRYVAVARGRVDVQGGLLQLYAPVSGTVASVSVHEGDKIDKGQTLARLDEQTAKANVTIAQGTLDQARAQVKVLDERIKSARGDAEKLRRAAKAGAGSQHDAEVATQKVRQLQGQRSEAEASVSVARGHLAIARRQLDLHRVRAPVAAHVTRVQVQTGSRAVAGSTPTFELLPERPRIVRAELNQEYVDAVHPGMRAQIVLDNDRQTVLGSARVARVGAVYSPSKLQDNPALSAGTRTVQCVLDFDKPSNLRIGQMVLVRILPGQDQRTPAAAKKGS